jgi:aryl-alcohol dehydrogenase-like predicted oxidoreductase
MEYANLGRTGLKVSRLCLGTMNFGPQADEEVSYQIMDFALDNGINFFDTANVYGWELGEGITEQIIGRWIAKGGGRRDNIVLAPKLYGRMGEGPNERRLSARNIRQACDDSLRRLQTDYIDLYQMHHVDRETPWEEIWQAMEQLVSQGKVLYVGSSNFAGLHIAKAQCKAEKRNFLGLVSEQSLYNLVDRTIELEVIPACREYGLGLIPYSPLSGGLLGGVLDKESKGRRSSSHIKKNIDKYAEELRTYESFCTEIGKDPSNQPMLPLPGCCTIL